MKSNYLFMSICHIIGSYAIKKEDIDQSRGNSSIVRYSYMNKNNVS